MPDGFSLLAEPLFQHLHIGLGKIADGRGVCLLDEQIAGIGMLEGKLHQIHSLVQVHQETGHVGIGDGDGLALLHLLNPQGNNRTSACHNVAITGAADGRCSILTELTTFGDGNLLHQCLADTHSVDGIGGLVGREDNNILHAVLDGREENIVGADDIGHCGLHREELAGGHLLEGGGVENVVNAVHSVTHAGDIADVADVELDLVGHLGHFGLELVAHIVLLLLVAGEDADLTDIGAQEAVEDGVTEGAGAAGDEQGFIGKQGHRNLPKREFCEMGTVTHYSLLYHLCPALSREKPSKKDCRGTKTAKKRKTEALCVCFRFLM